MVKADIGYYGELIGDYIQVALTVIGCLRWCCELASPQETKKS